MRGGRRLLDIAQLFEELSSVEHDGEAVRATPEDQALREVLNEIDDIARATLGSITIATMRKLVDRRDAGARMKSARSGFRHCVAFATRSES